MIRPDAHYVKSEGGWVAYQVIGEGPRDIVFITNWGTNLEVMWEDPDVVRFFEALARLGRVIQFDKRGSGLSDPVPSTQLPTLEDWLDDARVALDAAGSRRSVLIGDVEGGPMAMLFAATYPARTEALVLLNTFARWRRDDDYPAGMPEETVAKLVGAYEQDYIDGNIILMTAPGLAGNEEFSHRYARLFRVAMPPGAARFLYQGVLDFDVRSILPTIRVPTLVLHRRDSPWYGVGHGRYLAEHIAGAKYVELPGTDCIFYAGFEDVLREIREFLPGRPQVVTYDRVLATVLFTDIVGSTEWAAKLGDQKWLSLQHAHDAVVRQIIERFGGREIQTTGDGFIVTFDGPARAVRSAVEIAGAVRSLGLEIRAGLHTGEVELQDRNIGGIGVHIAARVMAEAQAGQVLASGTVKDLVVGSGIDFGDVGIRQLKGVPGEWRLFDVEHVP